MFQTLPGIILHFYREDVDQYESPDLTVSNPSRDYSAFLPEKLLDIMGISEGSFKPFQGLFCISTSGTRTSVSS